MRHYRAAAASVIAVLLAAGTPSWAQTLVACTEASPTTLNPQLTTANTGYDVAAQIYDRLVELDRGGSTIIPALAESWTISPDGLIYTFKLRPGVKFQANQSFTPSRDFNADDVLFSYRRMLDKSHPYYSVSPPTYDHVATHVAPVLDTIEKLDDLTIEMKLKAPSGPFLGVLTVEPMSIFSAEYGAAMLKAGTPAVIDQRPIGTGPFSFVSYQPDSTVALPRFPGALGQGRRQGGPYRQGGEPRLLDHAGPVRSPREA